jgi:hypothetical protein
MEKDFGMFGVTADRAKYVGSIWKSNNDSAVRFEIIDITPNYRVLFAEITTALRACVETTTTATWNRTMTLVRLS